MTRPRTPLTFDDGYLSLDELATYSGLSRSVLEEYLNEPDPLPSYRFKTRLVVRRSEFDEWALQFRVRREAVDIKALVDAKISGR